MMVINMEEVPHQALCSHNSSLGDFKVDSIPTALGKAQDADGIQNAQPSDAGGIGSVFGLFERDSHVTLCRVVHSVQVIAKGTLARIVVPLSKRRSLEREADAVAQGGAGTPA